MVYSHFKVGILGYGNLRTMSADKWAISKSTQLSTKNWVKLLLLLENAIKLNYWGPLTNWKFEPSPRSHIHSDPTINKHTEQVKKLVLKRIYRIFGYSFVNIFVRLQTNIHLISTNNHCHHSRDLCMRRVVVRSVSIRVDLDHKYFWRYKCSAQSLSCYKAFVYNGGTTVYNGGSATLVQINNFNSPYVSDIIH